MKILDKLFILAYVLFGTFAVQAQVQGESRLALLIGNATYKSSPLKNPVNDVRLMEASLTEAGFTVIKAENATRREMQRMVRDFGERLKQSGGVGLFYFAGHGVQVKGANYLVPVDADIRAEDEVAFDSVDAQSILEKMETAKNRINLLILDACRDNPFAKGSRSGSAGLATMSAPSGSLVAYSTAPGSVASDGSGNNGLYTQHLAAVMRMPDMPIEEVFKRVRANVRKDSANQQTPWENTALEGNFYFKRSPPVVVAAVQSTLTPMSATTAPIAPAAPNMMMVELAYWESIKTSNRPFELEAYIEQFPNGAFVGLAKARLREVAREIKAAEEASARAAAAVAASKATTPQPTAQPQIIAMATPSPTPAAPPLAPSAIAPVAALALTEGQRIGTLVVHDRVFNNKAEIKVAVTEKNTAYTVFSSGDKIAADGQVLTVRFGEFIFNQVRGALWKFPLKAGDKGQADVSSGGLNGGLQWQVKSGSTSSDLVVQVEFSMIGGGGALTSRTGTWSGDYNVKQQIPTATSFLMRPNAGGGNSRPQIVTTSLAP